MDNYSTAKPQKPFNPFLDDDENNEVDDFDFLNHPQQGSSGYMLADNDKPNQEWEQKRRQLLEERRQIEERTLMSTNKSLGLVYESEQIGIQTAEELMRQREQLRNTEYKVDEVNGMLRTSQKHLNVMKSIFGGIKSYFTGATPETDASKSTAFEKPECPASSKLQNAVSLSREETEFAQRQGYSHPALKARGLDTSGFKNALEDENDEDEKFMQGRPAASSLDLGYRTQTAIIEQKLDENLGEMGAGLSRLKHLAIGLGDEIEDQNTMLERLADKTERAELTIRNQNRQIGRILKK